MSCGVCFGRMDSTHCIIWVHDFIRRILRERITPRKNDGVGYAWLSVGLFVSCFDGVGTRSARRAVGVVDCRGGGVFDRAVDSRLGYLEILNGKQEKMCVCRDV